MWYIGCMENGLHTIMAAVQGLLDEACPADDDGLHDYTPAMLKRLQEVQDTVCKTLGLERRALIAPGD
jgi:hypothetical protein